MPSLRAGDGIVAGGAHAEPPTAHANIEARKTILATTIAIPRTHATQPTIDPRPFAGIRLALMPSDAERFQFIEKFRLHVSFHSDHVALMWQAKVQHWEASPPYYEVASGKTLAEATDAAIARWERKHRRKA